jgi:hypothetical protein
LASQGLPGLIRVHPDGGHRGLSRHRMRMRMRKTRRMRMKFGAGGCNEGLSGRSVVHEGLGQKWRFEMDRCCYPS